MHIILLCRGNAEINPPVGINKRRKLTTREPPLLPSGFRAVATLERQPTLWYAAGL